MSAAQELNERFGSGEAPLEPDVVSELQSIMRLYQLSEEELFYKWEEYCIKMDKADARVTLDSLRALKQDLQDALERSNRRATQTQPAPLYGGRNNMAGATPRAADVFGMLEGLTTPSPSVGKFTRNGVRAISAGKKRPAAGGDGVALRATTAAPRQPTTAATADAAPGNATPAKGTRPEDQLASLGALPPAPSFQDRVGAGDTVEVLNEHLPQPDPPLAPFAAPRVKLTAAADRKALNYKTMAMKISEVADVLDDRIDDFAELLLAARPDLDESGFGSAASQNTAQIIAVGRIASDAAAATAAEETGGGGDQGSAAAAKSAKLNMSSLVLEMSRSSGSGRRVHLNVSRLKGQFQFFPGQIVALKGTNASGKEFVVDEILSLPLLPNAASTEPVMQGHRQRLRGGDDDNAMDIDDTSSSPRPLSVIIASGPYTADDNLDFEPLHTLCDRAAEAYADVVLLAGPFLDAEHPLVAAGDFSSLPHDLLAAAGVDPDTATLGSLFRALVSPALGRLCAASPSTTAILLPSVRDAVAHHAAWPQDALPRRDLGLHRAVRVVGNPTMVNLNDCVLGASAQDVLWELRQTEVSGGGLGGVDPLARLCRHLVEQRHFFPVYPPLDRGLVPRTGAAELGDGGGGAPPPGAMLDVGYLKLGGMQGAARPDVMVVPSALPAFAKVVESVMFINPGCLSKRRGAGTYAKLTISAPKVTDEQAANGAMIGHNIFERARVEIVKI